MGQTTNQSNLVFQGYNCTPIHRGQLQHHALDVQLYHCKMNQLAVLRINLEPRSIQHLKEIQKYYQARVKVTPHPNACMLLEVKIEDQEGRTIEAHKVREMFSKRVDVNGGCNLSIFEGQCRRQPSQLSLHSHSPLTITLLPLHHPHTLHQLISKTHQQGLIHSQQQMLSIIEQIVKGTQHMLNNGCREPILSPITIKIDSEGRVQVGEWELTHFYQDQQRKSEEGMFEEEGQTVLQLATHSHSQRFKMQKEEEKDFGILTNYYWPPEGTSAIQAATTIGPPSHRHPNTQMFSLGMTLLHMILQRPLYQQQTYSQRLLTTYLTQAKALRKQQKSPLSRQFLNLIQKMTAWDPKQRISYFQIQKQLTSIAQKQDNYSSKYFTDNSSISRTMPPLQSVKSVILIQNINDSGSIVPGQGDESHPLAQTISQPQFYAKQRLKTDMSVDYHKLNYTISREKEEWKRFQDRLHHHSHQVLQGLSLFKPKAAQELIPDRQDTPQELILPINSREQQNIDEQEQEPQNEVSSLLLNDISHNHLISTGKKLMIHSSTAKQPPPSIITLLTPQSPQPVTQTMRNKTLKINGFMDDSDFMFGKQQNKYEQLFTPPELMAFLKSSAIDHQQTSRSKELQASPQMIASTPKSMTYSTYVKEQFVKGWYEGGKVEGLRNGYGTFHYNQGGKYCGDWQDSQMHGLGTLYYADGRMAYQGQWNHDSLHGKGVLYNQHPQKIQHPFDYHNFDLSEDIWVYYQGSFQKDDKNGYGILLLSNGQKYQGHFRNDLIQGSGNFHTLNGQIIKGLWKQNQLVGLQTEKSVSSKSFVSSN